VILAATSHAEPMATGPSASELFARVQKPRVRDREDRPSATVTLQPATSHLPR